MTPDYRLTVDGTDITPKVRPRLISLRLTAKRGNEANQLDLDLDDSDGKLAIPRTGAKIRLQLGYVETGLVDKGSFTVDEAEWSAAPGTVSIKARAADQTGNFRIRTERSWRDTTIGAIVRQLAGANGLEARIDPDLAGIAIPTYVQHHKSDMALLRQLGRENDAVATVMDGKLLFTRIGKGTTAGGKPLPGLVIRRSMVTPGSRLRFTDRGAGAGVEARWHDQDSGDRKTVKVGGGKGKAKRLRRVYHSEATARRAAQAENGRTARGGAEFTCSLSQGDATLYPERGATLQGFKAEADAITWIIVQVEHGLDKSGGFLTSLTLEQKG